MLANLLSIVTKIKENLIYKAKVRKQYAKIKAQQQEASTEKGTPAYSADLDAQNGSDEQDDSPEGAAQAEQMHPTRQLMLKDEDKAQEGVTGEGGEAAPRDGQRRRTRRPDYYDKQLQKGRQRRQEAEARGEEARKGREERERKLAERRRYGRAMAKTRDRDGRKKLGRESSILLDRVRKMMAES